MKSRKRYVVLFLVIFASAYVVPAQTADASKKPAYDAELAKRVGADKNGMRQYVIAFLKTGPNDSQVKGDARKAAFKGHFENMNRLAAEGKLAVAGPFADPEKKFRGLFILAVPTVEEAKKIAETDPVVKAGIMVVEYLPWFGSASLMLSNEFHYKVQKESM
jgi:uncharacterized protein YciI